MPNDNWEPSLEQELEEIAELPEGSAERLVREHQLRELQELLRQVAQETCDYIDDENEDFGAEDYQFCIYNARRKRRNCPVLTDLAHKPGKREQKNHRSATVHHVMTGNEDLARFLEDSRRRAGELVNEIRNLINRLYHAPPAEMVFPAGAMQAAMIVHRHSVPGAGGRTARAIRGRSSVGEPILESDEHSQLGPQDEYYINIRQRMENILRRANLFRNSIPIPLNEGGQRFPSPESPPLQLPPQEPEEAVAPSSQDCIAEESTTSSLSALKNLRTNDSQSGQLDLKTFMNDLKLGSADSNPRARISTSTLRDPFCSKSPPPAQSSRIKNPTPQDRLVRKPSEKYALKKPSEKETMKKPSEKETLKKPSEKETSKKPPEKETLKKPSRKEPISKPKEKNTLKKPSDKICFKKPSEKRIPKRSNEKDNASKPSKVGTSQMPSRSEQDSRGTAIHGARPKTGVTSVWGRGATASSTPIKQINSSGIPGISLAPIEESSSPSTTSTSLASTPLCTSPLTRSDFAGADSSHVSRNMVPNELGGSSASQQSRPKESTREPDIRSRLNAFRYEHEMSALTSKFPPKSLTVSKSLDGTVGERESKPLSPEQQDETLDSQKGAVAIKPQIGCSQAQNADLDIDALRLDSPPQSPKTDRPLTRDDGDNGRLRMLDREYDHKGRLRPLPPHVQQARANEEYAREARNAGAADIQFPDAGLDLEAVRLDSPPLSPQANRPLNREDGDNGRLRMLDRDYDDNGRLRMLDRDYDDNGRLRMLDREYDDNGRLRFLPPHVQQARANEEYVRGAINAGVPDLQFPDPGLDLEALRLDSPPRSPPGNRLMNRGNGGNGLRMLAREQHGRFRPLAHQAINVQEERNVHQARNVQQENGEYVRGARNAGVPDLQFPDPGLDLEALRLDSPPRSPRANIPLDREHENGRFRQFPPPVPRVRAIEEHMVEARNAGLLAAQQYPNAGFDLEALRLDSPPRDPRRPFESEIRDIGRFLSVLPQIPAAQPLRGAEIDYMIGKITALFASTNISGMRLLSEALNTAISERESENSTAEEYPSSSLPEGASGISVPKESSVENLANPASIVSEPKKGININISKNLSNASSSKSISKISSLAKGASISNVSKATSSLSVQKGASNSGTTKGASNLMVPKGELHVKVPKIKSSSSFSKGASKKSELKEISKSNVSTAGNTRFPKSGNTSMPKRSNTKVSKESLKTSDPKEVSASVPKRTSHKTSNVTRVKPDSLASKLAAVSKTKNSSSLLNKFITKRSLKTSSAQSSMVDKEQQQLTTLSKNASSKLSSNAAQNINVNLPTQTSTTGVTEKTLSTQSSSCVGAAGSAQKSNVNSPMQTSATGIPEETLSTLSSCVGAAGSTQNSNVNSPTQTSTTGVREETLSTQSSSCVGAAGSAQSSNVNSPTQTSTTGVQEDSLSSQSSSCVGAAGSAQKSNVNSPTQTSTTGVPEETLSTQSSSCVGATGSAQSSNVNSPTQTSTTGVPEETLSTQSSSCVGAAGSAQSSNTNSPTQTSTTGAPEETLSTQSSSCVGAAGSAQSSNVNSPTQTSTTGVPEETLSTQSSSCVGAAGSAQSSNTNSPTQTSTTGAPEETLSTQSSSCVGAAGSAQSSNVNSPTQTSTTGVPEEILSTQSSSPGVAAAGIDGNGAYSTTMNVLSESMQKETSSREASRFSYVPEETSHDIDIPTLDTVPDMSFAQSTLEDVSSTSIEHSSALIEEFDYVSGANKSPKKCSVETSENSETSTCSLKNRNVSVIDTFSTEVMGGARQSDPTGQIKSTGIKPRKQKSV